MKEPFMGSPTRALLWAALVAGALLATVILPAEYGIDPTGAGGLLGLTAMGKQKMAAAKANAQPPPAPPAGGKDAGPRRYATRSTHGFRHDSIDVSLAPGAEVEYKALLAEGEIMVFAWDAGGASVKFDFHGEPAAGPKGAFLTFHKGTDGKSAGSLEAPFTGTHGWYWKNTSAKPVLIKLRVSGFYSAIKRM